MKTLLMILLALAGNFAWATSPCEIEASLNKRYIERFLGLVKTGLKEQVVTLEDVRWARTQESPVIPILAGRDDENLSFRNGFKRLLRKINAADWAKIREQLDPIIDSKVELDQLVEESREMTRNVYTWKRRPFHTRGEIHKHVLTKAGEVFMIAGAGPETDIYELHSGTHHPLPYELEFMQPVDLFAAPTGQVAFAIVTKDILHVVDARTGTSLIDLPLTDVKELAASPLFGKVRFRALLYQSLENNHLMAAILHEGSDPHSAPPSTPIAVLDVTDKRVVRVFDAPSNQSATRAQDGQVYIWRHRSLEDQDAGTLVRIFNITANREVHSSVYSNRPSMASMYSVMNIDSNGHPQLYFLSNSDTNVVHHYDQTTRELVRLKEIAKTFSPQILTDPQGQYFAVGVEEVAPKVSDIVLQPFANPSNVRRFRIAANPASHFIAMIDTPRGTLLLFTQYNPDTGTQETLRILETETGSHESVRILSGFPDIPFYSQRDRRVYVYHSQGANSSRHLYQLFGPDK